MSDERSDPDEEGTPESGNGEQTPTADPENGEQTPAPEPENGEEPSESGGPIGADRQVEPATRHEEHAPLDELSREVRERREQREAEPDEELFEEVDVGEVDVESVWESLVSEPEEEGIQAEGKAIGAGADAEQVSEGGPARPPEHVLPKAEFCERCPYLSDPPELACEHEGTEIVEVTDAEHFRVRGCPFAAEEEPSFEQIE